MLKFYGIDDIVKTEVLSATIYGDPGLGKTSLSFTTKDCLLLDFDNGVQRTVGRKDFVRVDSWEDVRELQLSPQLANMAIKTIIVDTAGTMLDNYIADYVKSIDPKNARRGGEISLQGYGSMKTVFKQFKDWTKTLGANVIFICHATTDPNKEGMLIPKVTGGSLDILRQESDLIGYLHSNKNKRVIDFRPIDSHDGKDCAGIGLVEIPDYKTPEYENFMQGIIDRTLDKMNELNESQQATLTKIEEYRGKIFSVKSIKACNDIVKELFEEKKTIQIQVFTELRTHCTESNIATYDADNKKFIKYATVQSKS